MHLNEMNDTAIAFFQPIHIVRVQTSPAPLTCSDLLFPFVHIYSQFIITLVIHAYLLVFSLLRFSPWSMRSHKVRAPYGHEQTLLCTLHAL